MAYKNKLSNSDTPYIHGPYVVFEDGSTFSTADDSCIAVLTQDGEDHLNDANDFKAVFDDDAILEKRQDRASRLTSRWRMRRSMSSTSDTAPGHTGSWKLASSTVNS